MTLIIDIGLPELDDAQLDELAEECEREISNFILNEIPSKSIEDFFVTCILELDDILNLTIDINLVQQYDTGHDLEQVIEKASEFGSSWLEKRLREMK